MYVCMECGYEFDELIYGESCPKCGCGNIDKSDENENEEKREVE